MFSAIIILSLMSGSGQEELISFALVTTGTTQVCALVNNFHLSTNNLGPANWVRRVSKSDSDTPNRPRGIFHAARQLLRGISWDRNFLP